MMANNLINALIEHNLAKEIHAVEKKGQYRVDL
jgi:hypothetical protein